MTWYLCAVGNSGGTARAGEQIWELDSGRKPVPIREADLQGGLVLDSSKGKFGDSEDSFLYCCTVIRPDRENMALCAAFEVTGPREEGVQWQAGYGILAADTLNPDNRAGRHRNLISAGRYRMDRANVHSGGLRAVGGYQDPAAVDSAGRIPDASRSCGLLENKNIRCGERITMRLEKNDSGFGASFLLDGQEEILSFPGNDFLQKQDPESLFIGFAVAGRLTVRITEICAKVSPGNSSPAPEGAIRQYLPDYPLSRSYSVPERPAFAADLPEILHVSPDGSPEGNGREEQPLDLQSALLLANEKTTILLSDGIYLPERSYYAPGRADGNPSCRTGVCAANPGKAILDGSRLSGEAPLFLLAGNYWRLNGLVFRGSPSCGIHISGSGNVVEFCEACGCGDTGFLISSWPGKPKTDWPAYNRVEYCDSHDNADPSRENADGFGAKLSVGPGNLFYECMAYRNIDDGFDLYSKSILGPVEPVTIERCIAFENGICRSPEGSDRRIYSGCGFKLGGEKQPVCHRVRDCLAWSNKEKGFSSNSNPTLRLERLTALGNGPEEAPCNFHLTADKKSAGPDWKMKDLFPCPVPDETAERSKNYIHWKDLPEEAEQRSGELFLRTDLRILPTRNPDGSLSLHGLLEHKETLSGPDGKPGAVLGRRSKNLLILTNELGGGGEERVSVNLASGLAKRHRVRLMHLYPSEKRYPLEESVEILSGVPKGKGTGLAERCRKVRKAAKTADAVISLLRVPNLCNILAAGSAKKILSERNDPSRGRKQDFLLGKWMYRRADKVVFQSRKVRNLYSAAIRKKGTVIRNPVTVTCSAAAQRKKQIVTAGRLTAQKNHALLIRAFALFSRRFGDYELILYGGGPEKENLQNLARELGVGEKTAIRPFTPELHREIREAEQFVLSSDYEGLSNVLMEAMMMGIACVSTACTGSDELIVDGKTGLLVPVGDAQALAAAMERLAEDAPFRKKLEKNAKTASCRYEGERIIREWEELL